MKNLRIKILRFSKRSYRFDDVDLFEFSRQDFISLLCHRYCLDGISHFYAKSGIAKIIEYQKKYD